MALIIDIVVVPRSSKKGCILDKAGNLRCYLKAAPEKGKANEELIETVAKRLKIPKGAISILLGASSRKKRISIQTEGISREILLEKLGIERQINIVEPHKN